MPLNLIYCLNLRFSFESTQGVRHDVCKFVRIFNLGHVESNIAIFVESNIAIFWF